MIPIIAPGRVLKVNALTKRTGWVKIEASGVGGHSFEECTPIVGDQAWTRVTWKGGDTLGIEAGQGVTLRIQMYQAKLYGLEFE